MPRSVLALVLVAACSFRPPPAGHPDDLAIPTRVETDQRRLLEDAERWYPDVVITSIAWRPCNEPNSWYFPGSRSILLCTEMNTEPDAALFFAAHEFGHAATYQLAAVLDEEAADEVGALIMIRAGLEAELTTAARHWDGRIGHVRGDEHPSAEFRLWNLACMAAGANDAGSAECRALYASTRRRWDLRLGALQYGPAPVLTGHDPLE
jgi:hypothetical protein